MKKIFLLLFLTGTFFTVHAQNTQYTEHAMAAGETLSSIASKYETTVGDIMRLNGMNAESKLTLGQKIKISFTSGKRFIFYYKRKT